MGWLIVLAISAGVILTLRALGVTGPAERLPGRVACPACREVINPTALLCPFCQTDLVVGQAGRHMVRLRRGLLARQHRGQSVRWALAGGLLMIILLAIIYIWRAAR